jgi:oxalate decarboxylase/phosphoglucose isomerase-like protein (cupin superfamily)
MPARVLHAGDAFWRPSNQMGVLNCDLAKQLEAQSLAARFWRLTPGQASTKHRHQTQTELYVVLEGTGRMRIGEDDAVPALTLARYSSVIVEPDEVRQVFNDTGADALWLVVGTPPELGNTLEMTAAQLAALYPDGPQALPPELTGG